MKFCFLIWHSYLFIGSSKQRAPAQFLTSSKICHIWSGRLWNLWNCWTRCFCFSILCFFIVFLSKFRIEISEFWEVLEFWNGEILHFHLELLFFQWIFKAQGTCTISPSLKNPAIETFATLSPFGFLNCFFSVPELPTVDIWMFGIFGISGLFDVIAFFCLIFLGAHSLACFDFLIFGDFNRF